MEYLLLVILLLISYLLGSIPFALIVGKKMYKTDVRGYGSGNLGGTNTFRVLGKKAGVLVALGDLLKGGVAASLPLIIGSDLDPFIVGLPAVFGHCYPIFAQFKGGKAMATSGGVLLVADPTLFLIMFVFFVILLARTKIVSLSSMVSAIVLHGFMIWKGDTAVALATLFLLVLILYRHRDNIARIVAKTEPKVKW
ncbi:glycerol-3-phosphate 1-O-acyltransferase PlsY [Anaerobacillus isosaccharinicus]|uniref:Glycerol-3-phosphate acyltransferase n=1 Tax=Anaerobacillus isosaccharinicus TaxID=1532552 RepID=A0A1S2LQE2_9BACI|nr:glycerol-3-phosphate 1-O-acyltransferase PlsY [Anaerobacillus isosaccharinicus]MBA5586329.1 glycerol-3-phosphate 1-O-acyltransferase PlsY [Anaerobacillus isosaccharinicus]QOY35421.1 glycerol-3-phosphate 1-O-acyltransferase PlsY [Anaerobacillus isosaccharinicus]